MSAYMAALVAACWFPLRTDRDFHREL